MDNFQKKDKIQKEMDNFQKKDKIQKEGGLDA